MRTEYIQRDNEIRQELRDKIIKFLIEEKDRVCMDIEDIINTDISCDLTQEEIKMINKKRRTESIIYDMIEELDKVD